MKQKSKRKRKAAMLTRAGRTTKADSKAFLLAVEAPGPEGDLTPSARGRLRQKAREVIDKTPEVRAEKVAALRAAIRLGTYRPDARKIAAKMIEELLEEI